MNKNIYWFLLILITIVGFIVRFLGFTQLPAFGETSDELHYTWGGNTWIKTGVPKSWSWFVSYKQVEKIERNGIVWDIKSPMIEKPPLYFLVSGTVAILAGSKDLYETRPEIIRILPLVLSIFSIFFIGLLAKNIFSPVIGLIAAGLYSITPTIILTNRLSVTENLLTPFALLSLWLITKDLELKTNKLYVITLGITCALAFLTKQIGVAVALSAMLVYLSQKKWHSLVLILFFLVAAICLYFGFARFYDWNLFWELQKELQQHHALQGLPEVFSKIFRYPIIIGQDKQFPDGTILLGYIFLFTAPLWLNIANKLGDTDIKKTVFLSFPFLYLLLFVIGESGSTDFTFWGWYVLPFFPFLTITLAKIFSDLWQKPNLFTLLLLVMGLGSSDIRFLFLQLPFAYHTYWQLVFIFILLLLTTSRIFVKYKWYKLCLIIFLIIHLGINLYTGLNLPKIYPDLPFKF
jgi:4-amino-4-deoxy-L-arabinose transferase-like glycosyltransferase